MTIPSFDAGSTKAFPTGSNPTSETWSHTVAAGNGRILFAVVSTPETADSVTFDSVSLTLWQDNGSRQLWYLLNPNVGALTMQVNDAAGLNDGCALAASYSGVNVRSIAMAARGLQEDNTAGGAGEHTITNVLATELVTSAIAYDSGSSGGAEDGPEADEGITRRANIGGGAGSRFTAASIGDEPGSTGSVVVGWTHDGDGGATYWSFALVGARGGNRAAVFFSEAWRSWEKRVGGLLAPRGMGDLWKPQPQVPDLIPAGVEI